MTLSASTVIAAPAAAVFDILADPRRHQLIDGSGTLTGSVSGPDRLELGSKFAMGMKQGAPYRVRNTVVEFETDRLIAWKHVAPQIWRYELAPATDGTTKVTETWDTDDYPKLARPVLDAVFAARTRRGLEQTLAKLRAAAEAG